MSRKIDAALDAAIAAAVRAGRATQISGVRLGNSRGPAFRDLGGSYICHGRLARLARGARRDTTRGAIR